MDVDDKKDLIKLINHENISHSHALLACERQTPLRDVSRGRTSASQRQKSHTDDVNKFLNPVVMGYQMQICSILRFSWSIFAKCCVHLRMNSSKPQMLLKSREAYIPQTLAALLEIHRVYI